ncbi:MAG: TadE/TadG family type IV pilus assembly protein [Terracidiphilus sp.]|nr:TadE/TadG family type IV pilus assembly protein [Terracidiphilus sp.]
MRFQIDTHGIARSLRRIVNRAPAAPRAHLESRSPGRRLRVLLRGGEQGSALVEIALVMPALLAVITAICAFAVAFNNQLTLTQAVGAGAQYLQTVRSNPAAADPCAAAIGAIENAAPNFKPSSISLTLSINGTPETGASCTGGATALANAQGFPVTVSATYPCVLSIMPAGYGTKFIGSCQLSASVTEYEY